MKFQLFNSTDIGFSFLFSFYPIDSSFFYRNNRWSRLVKSGFTHLPGTQSTVIFRHYYPRYVEKYEMSWKINAKIKLGNLFSTRFLSWIKIFSLFYWVIGENPLAFSGILCRHIDKVQSFDRSLFTNFIAPVLRK